MGSEKISKKMSLLSVLNVVLITVHNAISHKNSNRPSRSAQCANHSIT